jgi:hypothetical protein
MTTKKYCPLINVNNGEGLWLFISSLNSLKVMIITNILFPEAESQ